MTFPDLNETSFVGITQYVVGVTDGAFGLTVLVVFFVISFALLKVYPTKRALLASLFFTNTIGILLWVLGALSEVYLITAWLILAVFAVFYLKMEDET